MKYTLLIVAALVVLMSCGKNNYQTKPQIKVKSVNTTTLPQNGDALLVTTYSFTDKEGDIKNGTFTYLPVLLNKRPLSNTTIGYQPIDLPIDFDIPDNSKADFELRLQRANIYLDIVQGAPTNDKNDTILIKAVFKDAAGNVSDTATTDKIVLLGQ
jgi:hypothetical protein